MRCQLLRPMMRANATRRPARWTPPPLHRRKCTPPALEDCAVLELRDYKLHPGRRDELIALFERELIEPQEAAGLRVIGSFATSTGRITSCGCVALPT